jgi:hypothetical protein
MALDFAIVTDVRQRFGDGKRDEIASSSERESGIEADAPFVGPEKLFAFRCPSVDRRQFALLLFQTLGVSVRQNLEINGQTIFGGIAPSVDFDSRAALTRWNGNVMLIHPGVLQENNLMRIRAAHMAAGNADDFVIDNVVVVFKNGGRGAAVDRRSATTAKARAQRPAKRGRKAAKKRR